MFISFGDIYKNLSIRDIYYVNLYLTRGLFQATIGLCFLDHIHDSLIFIFALAAICQFKNDLKWPLITHIETQLAALDYMCVKCANEYVFRSCSRLHKLDTDRTCNLPPY